VRPPPPLLTHTVLIFTFGAPRSGKSFTLFGNSSSRGIVHLVVDDVYAAMNLHRVRSRSNDAPTSVRVAMVDVFDETISNLLNPEQPALDLFTLPTLPAVHELNAALAPIETVTKAPAEASHLLSAGHSVFAFRNEANARRVNRTFEIIRLRQDDPHDGASASFGVTIVRAPASIETHENFDAMNFFWRGTAALRQWFEAAADSCSSGSPPPPLSCLIFFSFE
jgi:hypothetical protein